MEETVVSIRAIEDVGPDTVAVTLETPHGFDAEPGQFVLVRRLSSETGPDGDSESAGRYYTISSPRVGSTFEITVEIDPEGTISPWLGECEPGDEIVLKGPFGNVFYDGDGPVLVIAGGPGIGPALGIAERAMDEDEDVALVYVDEKPVHKRRLEDLSEAGVSVSILDEKTALDRELELVLETGQPYVFGFKPFCERALDAIEAAGGDPDRAAVENFG